MFRRSFQSHQVSQMLYMGSSVSNALFVERFKMTSAAASELGPNRSAAICVCVQSNKLLENNKNLSKGVKRVWPKKIHDYRCEQAQE